ncbi:MAG: excinuclease ABC subunit UvrA, partial [Bacteroidales bacterium]
MKENHSILIKGARVNNLKNIDVEIPRDEFVVITGLSGSGKSSLAFETLYAEGQRRYVESLSAYARQFLGRMSKPECDYIKGIPPAIAIEQKVNTRNPRSTVGTSTEIYDYLRMLFARIGKTYSPVSGKLVKKHSVEDVLEVMSKYPERTRIALYAPFILPEGRSFKEQLDVYLKQGFNRVEVENEITLIEDLVRDQLEIKDDTKVLLLIDRLSCSTEKDAISRLTDSVETAFFEGHGSCIIRVYNGEDIEELIFSKKFEEDGMTFQEPNDLMFSFNSPVGACPKCEGFGKVVGIDEDLVIPNKGLSLYEGAVVCWKGDKMGEWKNYFISKAHLFGFPIHRPYNQLTEEQKDLLWNGNAQVEGIWDFFRMLEENQYKIQYRVMLARYRGKTTCPVCHGSRLKPEALYVRIGGHTILELVRKPIGELSKFFQEIDLDEHDQIVAKRLLVEINNRLKFLVDVGLSYLTLDRLSASL